MNDATQGEEVKAKRERQFGRVYDHDAGTLTITSAFNPEFKLGADLAAIPQKVLEGFALQAIGDYIVNEANDALKDEANGDEASRRLAAIAAANEALKELVDGAVDFRSGVGLGGMRSVIGALGAVLFEAGKTFVKDNRGNEIKFNDVHSAREAVKALYLGTVPKGPMKDKTDKDGKVVKDEHGHAVKVPVDAAASITSRMIFNAIRELDWVKAGLEAKRKVAPKKERVQGGDMLG